jgi:hypothetical protein
MKIKQLSLILMVLLVITGFMSCDLNSSDEASLAIIGEWDTGYVWDGVTYESKIVLTETVFQNYSGGELLYSAKIVSFENSGWNGGESGEGEHGYIVIQFDNNKYMVLRWENFIAGTSMDYSEGYNFVTEEYFDTPEDAIVGATEATGFFGGFSSTTKL